MPPKSRLICPTDIIFHYHTFLESLEHLGDGNSSVFTMGDLTSGAMEANLNLRKDKADTDIINLKGSGEQ